jgi:tRNA-(ms[2]io[6]A)-hydroxylase
VTADLQPIRAFLPCPTPQAWLERAEQELEILLIDHAHCEKKAAGTALNLMFRYATFAPLQHQLSRLAREELRHFEQVLGLIQERGMTYRPLTASRYAGKLREQVRTTEPGRLVDTLIVGAIIEARSCERFAAIAPRLKDAALAKYYRFLLKSEARHFQEYLRLAELAAGGSVENHVRRFLEIEARLITSPDPDFRFHSGVPV